MTEHSTRTAGNKPQPWTWSSDKTKWTVTLPDGRPAVIERLEDGDEDGNGASFLPSVAGAPGPVCDGVLAAARWVDEFAAQVTA